MKEKLMTVHEVSEMTGVSIRTLHYYDEVGLLSPTASTDAGYRLYDDTALRRLQSIMLFRELEFSLKDIKAILDSPKYSQAKALNDQIRILELRREHLERLIAFAKGLKLKGEKEMNFKAFDKSEIEAYQKQAKERWGETEAYREYEKKSSGYSQNDQKRLAEGLMELFAEFGTLMNLECTDSAVQAQVKKLQDYITANYYTCTDEILSGLGQMYAAEGKMKDNIDAAGGEGCAFFASKAIAMYCKKA